MSAPLGTADKKVFFAEMSKESNYCYDEEWREMQTVLISEPTAELQTPKALAALRGKPVMASHESDEVVGHIAEAWVDERGQVCIRWHIAMERPAGREYNDRMMREAAVGHREGGKRHGLTAKPKMFMS